MTLRFIYTFSVVVAFVKPDTGAAQTGSFVLENYFKVTGGKGKLDSLITASKQYHYYTLYGKRDSSQVDLIEKVPYGRYSKASSLIGRLRYESFRYKEKSVLASYEPFPSVIEREAQDEIFIHPAQEILFLYRSGRLRNLTQQTLNSQAVYKVISKASTTDLTKTFYFDQSSCQLVASQTGHLPDNFIFYKDYRKIDGILFPMSVETYQRETFLDLTNYSSIALNTAVHDSIFYFDELTRQPKRNKESKHNSIEWVEPSPATFNDLLNAFKGQTILIDIWATWCGPCKQEFLNYSEEFYDFLAAKKIKMLFISTDKPEHSKPWKRDVNWFNINGYHLLASNSLSRNIHERFSIEGIFFIPRYILIGSNGQIISDNLGKPSNPDFRKKVSVMLK